MSSFKPHELRVSIEELMKYSSESGVCVSITGEHGIRILNPETWRGITVYSVEEAIDIMKRIDSGDQTMLEF